MKNFKLKIKNSQRGFTLIEMLVVITIVATISGISIVGFRKGEKQKRLAFAAETVITALRNAQLYSLSGKNIPGSVCAPGGVADKSAKSFLVKNINNSSLYEVYGIDNCDTAILMESFTLPTGTKVNNPSIRINGTLTDDDWKLKFTVPFGAVSYGFGTSTNGGTFLSFTTAVISLESSDSSITDTVSVDGISGRIE